ncbi:MAG: hypothetical protein EBS22_02045 [Acidimicrobiia bacterium]|nr:hypothetical protein [Acidimicrobiia bacterium]
MRRPIGLTAATLVLVACGTTTYDETVATSTVVATTTTLPEGTAVELLPRLVTGLSDLSLLIGPVPADRGDGDKTSRLAEVEALWAAVEREVVADDPDVADSIVRMLDLARLAVERSRPADADKAAKFVADVVRDYLSNLAG